MADLCVDWTFGDLTIYGDAADGQDRLVWTEDGLTGWDGAPIRRWRDPASREDGANVGKAYLHGKLLTIRAGMVIGSVGHDGGPTTEYLTAYNDLEADVKAKLLAKLNTPTAFGCTPTGGPPESIQAVYGSEGEGVAFVGGMMARVCMFTLVEASEIID